MVFLRLRHHAFVRTSCGRGWVLKFVARCRARAFRAALDGPGALDGCIEIDQYLTARQGLRCISVSAATIANEPKQAEHFAGAGTGRKAMRALAATLALLAF